MSGRHVTRLLAAFALGLLAAGCSSAQGQGSSGPHGRSTPAATAAAKASSKPYDMRALLVPGHGKLFGVEADGVPDSLSPLISVADSIGRKPNVAGQYVAWGAPFDATGAAHAWSYGALYYMAWEPFNTSVAAIAAGSSDNYIRKFATAVSNLGIPVAISFGHEMNGNWYPWGTAQTSAAKFVAAWRHIHAQFTRAGARNVVWVWNANVINPVPNVALRPYWPGNGYVNWIGVTGYCAVTGPHTFAGIFGPTMREIRRFTNKPFIVAETGVETSTDEGGCTRSLVRGVAALKDVIGFIWFDYDKDGVDWRIESRPQVRASLAGAIAGLRLANVRE